jgi:hypothetical protein
VLVEASPYVTLDIYRPEIVLADALAAHRKRFPLQARGIHWQCPLENIIEVSQWVLKDVQEPGDTGDTG